MHTWKHCSWDCWKTLKLTMKFKCLKILLYSYWKRLSSAPLNASGMHEDGRLPHMQVRVQLLSTRSVENVTCSAWEQHIMFPNWRPIQVWLWCQHVSKCCIPGGTPAYRNSLKYRWKNLFREKEKFGRNFFICLQVLSKISYIRVGLKGEHCSVILFLYVNNWIIVFTIYLQDSTPQTKPNVPSRLGREEIL